MEYRLDGQTYYIRLLKGEKLIDSLGRFCRINNISAGWFSAIGAISEASLSFYLLDKKKYQTQIFKEQLEICSLTGNVATLDGKLVFHIHTCLSQCDFRTIGGHLNNATIAATCEIIFQTAITPLIRHFDDDIGLNLLKLDC